MGRAGIGWPFAEVAVDVPVDRGRLPGADTSDGYHYAVPPEMAHRLEPGHRVRVPFGRRLVAGVVVALHAQSPVERTRDLAELIGEEPALSPADIALARWMSAHYLAPFYECLRCFLPPGEPGGHLRWVERSGAPLEADRVRRLPEPAQRLLGLLGKDEGLDEEAIVRAGLRQPGRAIAALEAAGLARSELRPRAGRVGPKRRQMALALELDEARVDAALRRLRPNRKAAVLAWLRRPEALLPSLEDLRAATGATAADLRDLEESGAIRVSAGERKVESRLDPAAAEALIDAELGRAPAQARILAWLAQAGGPRERGELLAATESGASSLDALVEAGHVQAIEIPSSVLLELSDGRAREHEMELRRCQPHAEAMAYLAASGGRAPVAEIVRSTRARRQSLRDLAEAGLIELGQEQVWRDPLAGGSGEAPSPAPALTEDQARAWQRIEALMGRGGLSPAAPRVSYASRPRVCLLHGVTGSGKTEIYLRAIERCLFGGRQAIVLVPEIALTPQTVRRFAGRFPGRVGVWHSELSEGERLDTWERARRGLLDVIVGSRSAVFAPLPRLGLIVVDESHGEAYKQARTPRYHARDVALRRAGLQGALALLGSATPSLESYWEARRGHYDLLELPRRVATAERSEAPAPASAVGAQPGDRAPMVAWGELPPVEIVDLRAELKAGNTSMFSRALRQALVETLEQGGQAILFLNRRGSATFVLCRDCGEVLHCPRCQTPLTHHHQGGLLVCHHCSHRQPPPMMCPACGSPRIRYFGAGTEKLEAAAGEAFPEARVLRWDADTTGRKGSHAAILARFIEGRADILVGTQMIAKGLDLPRVTLVGVVSADTGLHFPDFRSAERSFQLLSQVAGRAGRSERGGRVIFQTYAPEHPAILAAARHDYAGFYAREIDFRRQQGYPPFGRLVRLIYLTKGSERAAGQAARELADRLREEIDRQGLADTRVIGPAPAFFGHLRGRRRWHLILQSPNPQALLAGFQPGPGWRVDVDPVDLL